MKLKEFKGLKKKERNQTRDGRRANFRVNVHLRNSTSISTSSHSHSSPSSSASIHACTFSAALSTKSTTWPISAPHPRRFERTTFGSLVSYAKYHIPTFSLYSSRNTNFISITRSSVASSMLKLFAFESVEEHVTFPISTSFQDKSGIELILIVSDPWGGTNS